MPYKIKVNSKRQLKEPDEYVSTVEGIVSYVKDNLRVLGILISISLVAAIAYGAFIIKERTDDAKAVKLEYDASRYYFGSGPEKKGQDLKKAIDIYQKISADYKRSSSAPIALYYMGNAHLDLKEYDAAINAYKGFTERYPDKKDLVSLVYQRLGYAYLAKGDDKDAVESFNKAAGLELAKNRDQSLYESGRILEKMGQKDDALKKYKEIVTSFPSSPYSSEAQVKIKGLGGDQTPKDTKKDDKKVNK